MNFKSLSSELRGTTCRLLSESYEDFLRKNPQFREAWQRDWQAYDSEVSSHPDTVGKCGFFSYVHDELAGFASYDPRGYPAKAVIGHNCILPGLRGIGYGRLQMRELLRILRQRGFKKAVVSTGSHEFFAPAIQMYKFCGFKEAGNSRVDAGSGLRMIELECDLSITVRKAEEKDFARVLALFRQLWPGRTLNRKSQEGVYHAMLESDGYELLCVERKGKVKGFASLSIQHNFWQEGKILYITTMIVDEKSRGQGLGAALVGEIETMARDRGCGKIELDSAFHRREAHDFYEKMGFEKRAYFFSKDVS